MKYTAYLQLKIVVSTFASTARNYRNLNIISMENLTSTPELLKSLPGFSSQLSEVNGINIHYIQGGQGQPLILIPGYPQTWWAYQKIMPQLAGNFKVMVVEMRGMGCSDKP